MAVDDPVEYGRLWNSMQSSRKALRKWRDTTRKAVQQYVGFHYSSNGAPDKVPLNVIELSINTYMQLLAARPPKAMVTTQQKPLKAFANDKEAVLNRQIQQLKLIRPIRRGIRNALFSMGVVCVGQARTGSERELYVDDVNISDWVHDMRSTRYESSPYSGHRYQMDLDEARDNPRFDKKVREKLAADPLRKNNEGGDERLDAVSQSELSTGDDYKDQVDLWQVWLRKEKKLVTIPEGGGKPLEVRDWKGPDCGPYHMLGFAEVPGQVMPLSPVMNMLDLHMPINELLRKVIRKAVNLKDVGVTRDPGGAQKIINAGDMEVVSGDPDSIKFLRANGADPTTIAAILQLRELWDWGNGNMSMLAGLGPQSSTVGQDQIIQSSASMRISEMQSRVAEWVKDIIEALAWYVWHEPSQEFIASRPDSRFRDIQIPVRIRPGYRPGKFDLYDFDIQPYSMRDRTPEQQLSTVIQFVTQVYMPLMQLSQQQGAVLDVPELFRLFGQLTGMTQLEEIIRFSTPSEKDVQSPETPPPNPLKPNGNYTRTNRQGATTGKSRAMIATLLGKGVQGSEVEGSMRPTG